MESSKNKKSIVHILSGAYDQVIKFKLKKQFRRWLDKKIVQYREIDKLNYDSLYLREVIEDKEVAAHYFIREFKDGFYSI